MWKYCISGILYCDRVLTCQHCTSLLCRTDWCHSHKPQSSHPPPPTINNSEDTKKSELLAGVHVASSSRVYETTEPNPSRMEIIAASGFSASFFQMFLAVLLQRSFCCQLASESKVILQVHSFLPTSSVIWLPNVTHVPTTKHTIIKHAALFTFSFFYIT